MKKKLIIIGSIVLAAAILCAGVLAYIILKKPFSTGSLVGTDNGAQYGHTLPDMPMRADGTFVVLQFTDTHLINGKGKDLKTLEALAAQLDAVKPDLAVITGDMLDGFNAKWFVDKRGALAAIADLFEQRAQYWAYVPGNNDGEILGSTADVVSFLAQNYEHCLLSNEEGLTGETQYVISIMDADGETAHELIFMDSLMRDPETHYATYDCFKQDQADWLQARLKALKAKAPDARASVFFHMNTPAFTEAKNKGEPYKEGYAMPDFPDSWAIQGSYVVDNVMAEAGNVGLVSIGHLHPPVNWCAFWDGAYYHITRAAGYQITKQPGGVKITIHPGSGNARGLYEFDEIVF